MSDPAILVLGGTGAVGSRIVDQLSSSSKTVLVASRNGNGNGNGSPDADIAIPPPHVHRIPFDWHDTDTWTNPFSTPTQITAAYLIAPPSANAESIMTQFVDFARRRGVRRFVLQSASSIEPGGPAMGKVHDYLRELGQRGKVEWAVLRPTWFQQNFVNQPAHLRSIRDESKIYSAAGGGKIPWVSVEDVAAVAVRALTDEPPPNTEYTVLGPELLSYGDIASILSEVLGRTIVHVNLSHAELEKRHMGSGIPEDYARMLSTMDTSIKFGSEDRTNDAVYVITGTAPKKFRDFANSVKDVWEISSKFESAGGQMEPE